MKKILIITFLLTIAFSNVFGLKEFSDAFIEVAENANPAVVSIVSEKVIKNDFHEFFSFPGFDDYFKEDFKSPSLGSGVIIDAKKGYIITNNHVIDKAEEIKILLLDKREIEAEVIATDPPSDIALLRIDADDLVAVEFGNSNELRIGEWVIAIGSPFGINLNHTVTAGIVSAKGRSDVVSRVNFENFIQHDAAINPGNSGGALLNLNGDLVGINTAIATDGFSRANAGVGFAIPVNQVKRIVTDLIDHGHVSRGWLGVSIQDIDENMARALDLEIRTGVIISQVFEDSPAEKNDIEEEDIIIKVNNIRVEDASHLKNLVAAGHPGDKMEFTIIRNEKEKNITIKLGTRPGEEDLQYAYSGSNNFDIIGLKVENLDSKAAREYDIETDKGVVVTEVKKGSVSREGNIREGDVIVKISKKNIRSVSDYREVLDEFEIGDSILLLIKRGNSSRFIALEIE